MAQEARPVTDLGSDSAEGILFTTANRQSLASKVEILVERIYRREPLELSHREVVQLVLSLRR